MSATPTDAPPHRGWRGRLNRSSGALLAGLLLAGLLGGCAEEPLPQRQISHKDCLSEVKLANLKEAIARCNKVVAAFPKDPLPLNERFLLHTLAENDRAACNDIQRAAELARQAPPGRLDAVLRRELTLRQADCREAGLTPAQSPAAKAGAAAPPATASPAVQQLPHQNR